MNKFLFSNLFILIFLSHFHEGYIRNEIPDFDYRGCPSRNDSTVSVVETTIILKSYMKNWPFLGKFIIKRKEALTYIYSPSQNMVEKDDVRFFIKRDPSGNHFSIVSKFQYDDSGADFQYGYQKDRLSNFMSFCSVLINEDLTMRAILERHAPPELGFRDKKYYMEGERIIVVCTVQKLNNATFKVHFPKGTIFTLEDQTEKSQEYSVTLTKNIKGGNISCILSKGVSTWNNRFLRFVDKPIEVTEPNRTNLAISIAVFSCLMLIVMLIFGSYTLIVKQRKDQTKVMIEHHTQTARSRMNSRISQIQRMSMSIQQQQMSDYDE